MGTGRGALADNPVLRSGNRMSRRLRPSHLGGVAVLVLAGCAGVPRGGGTGPSDTPTAAAASRANATAGAPPASLPTATPPAAAPPAGTPARLASAATPTPLTPPGSPPPFAVVTKDAKRSDGPIAFWQKGDKVWLELKPSDFGRPFLLSPKIRSGIGEAWVLGGLMTYPINGAGGPQLIEFVRVHNTVRMQARNTDIVARPGTPEARAVADSYSASLLGAASVASAAHPESQAVLVEANSLFLTDLAGIGMLLQRGFRQGYGLDRSNSGITAVRSSSEALIIETQSHYYTSSISTSAPTLLPGLPSGGTPVVPRFLPDARSLLVGLHYSIAPLPEQPMPARAADPRIGLFSTTLLDFSDDLQASPRRRIVNRWRLEKKDPAAETSEPVRPITFWIDRNVPLAYRDTVRAAILEWNKAFERIGFKDAIVVKQQPDDATFDTLDFGVNSVRWMMNADPVFGAIGPSHVDPRSGEILDADIAFEGMSARSVRGMRSQVLGAATALARSAAQPFVQPFPQPFEPPAGAAEAPVPGAGAPPAHDHQRCQYGALAAEQLGYALDVLEARGELDPDSPAAQNFVLDYVRDALMHEVGHALGLRHNFRASRVYTEAQLADPEFTKANGTTGSVMEYNAVNLPAPGRRGGTPFMTTLGPYDYWAVEYAYKPLPPGSTPEQERAALQAVAARSSEPLLAYGTDEDSLFAIDPETIQLDLGNDPIAFAAKRIAIARDLFRRQETRELSPQRDYAVLRRSLGFAIGDVSRAVGVLVRQIGGVRTLRDFPGSGRDPLVPVAAPVQRAALELIADAVLAPDALTLSAPLQRRLAPDFQDRAEMGLPTDYSVPQRLFELQRAVLGHLMSEPIAARILDSVGKFDRPQDAFQLRELYARLQQDVWSELDRGNGAPAAPAAIAPQRRELQREHVNRLAAMVLRPGTRADARGALRQQARELLPRLQAAARRRADADTRAHLEDSADTLRRALAAPLLRGGL
jgi:hypothetical protein